LTTLLLALAAFCSGSIPFGYLIGRARGIDIRAHGSKNIGATNVGRVLGRPLGFLCFGLDLLKGLLPTLAAGWTLGTLGDTAPPAPMAWAWLGIMAASVLGHMFSPWVGFKGGKGVATGFGALLGVWPLFTLPGLLALVIWLVSVKLTRYVGVSSCLAAGSLPITAALTPAALHALGLSGRAADAPGVPGPHVIVGGALAALVIIKHRGNLARTWAGTEFKIGQPRPTPPVPPTPPAPPPA
jgi:glycerol-3-phosphate acyltransferase PlsY